MNSASLDFLIFMPAFLAGMLVLLTHIPLGAQVLQRGIVFIDLAIAQIAALGVIVAVFSGLDPEGWMVRSNRPNRSFACSSPPTVNGNTMAGICACSDSQRDARPS